MIFLNIENLMEYTVFVVIIHKIITMVVLLYIRFKKIPVHPGKLFQFTKFFYFAGLIGTIGLDI